MCVLPICSWRTGIGRPPCCRSRQSPVLALLVPAHPRGAGARLAPAAGARPSRLSFCHGAAPSVSAVWEARVAGGLLGPAPPRACDRGRAAVSLHDQDPAGTTCFRVRHSYAGAWRITSFQRCPPSGSTGGATTKRLRQPSPPEPCPPAGLRHRAWPLPPGVPLALAGGDALRWQVERLGRRQPSPPVRCGVTRRCIYLARSAVQ